MNFKVFWGMSQQNVRIGVFSTHLSHRKKNKVLQIPMGRIHVYGLRNTAERSQHSRTTMTTNPRIHAVKKLRRRVLLSLYLLSPKAAQFSAKREALSPWFLPQKRKKCSGFQLSHFFGIQKHIQEQPMGQRRNHKENF